MSTTPHVLDSNAQVHSGIKQEADPTRGPSDSERLFAKYKRGDYYPRVSDIMLKAGMGAGDVENILANLWEAGWMARGWLDDADAQIPDARAARLLRYGVTLPQIRRAEKIIQALGLKAWQVSLFVQTPGSVEDWKMFDIQPGDRELERDNAVLSLVDHHTGQQIKIYPPLTVYQADSLKKPVTQPYIIETPEEISRVNVEALLERFTREQGRPAKLLRFSRAGTDCVFKFGFPVDGEAPPALPPQVVGVNYETSMRQAHALEII